MEPQEILNSHSDLITPIQKQYLTAYVELGSYCAVAKKYGLSESTVRRSIKSVLKRFAAKQSSVPQHMDDAIPEPFMMERYSAMYDKDGNRRMHWVKAKTEAADFIQGITEAIEDLCAPMPPREKVKDLPKHVDKDLLTAYPLGDPHIGLLTYKPEVGHNWDLKIAEEVFLPHFDELIQVAPKSKECLIVDLGDFWHYDAMDQRTTRSGHKVDADGRPSKMIEVGYRIITRMIDTALLHHQIVNVKILPGNHDDLGSIFLRVSLKLLYRNEPRVKIDDSPNVFQYFKWGNTLIGMHHGDKCKMQQLGMVMAADRPVDWGNSEFRYWWVGHFHNDSSVIQNGKELQGCRAETFRTLAGNEGYAHEAGYRSDQDGKAIVIHKEYGEIHRHTVNVGRVRKKNS